MSKPDGGPAKRRIGKDKTGGQAFPGLLTGKWADGKVFAPDSSDGMSLRDYYKGQALIGLANRLTDERFEHLFNGTQGGMKEAIVAGVLADAMLQEREK